jgi:hypothetical protein
MQIIISFALGAGLTVIASIAGHFLRPSAYNEAYPPPDPSTRIAVTFHSTSQKGNPNLALTPEEEKAFGTASPQRKKWSRVLDRLILGLSDQQIATSLIYLITAFTQRCEISNYHLNIVCDIAWFSTVTHFLSLVVLRVYWTEEGHRLALNIRIALVLCVIIFLAFALFWSSTFDSSPGVGACPAQCTFTHPDASIILSEFNLSSNHNIRNFAGLLQSALLTWGCSTAASFVVPW